MSTATDFGHDPRKLGLDITVNTKNADVERLSSEKTELLQELEGERQKREALEADLTKERLNQGKIKAGCNDESIDTQEKLRAWESGKQEHSSSSAGTIPLGSQGDSEKNYASINGAKGYDNYVDMHLHLKELEHSTTPQERTYANTVFNRFWSQNLDAVKKTGQTIIYETEGLREYLDKQNEALRKKEFSQRGN